LALSLLQAFSELVVYLKIWQGMKFMEQEIRLKDVVSEMRSKEKESHYWQSDAMVKSGGGFLHRIRRKLKV
jgi:hypothetical protein